MVTRSVIQRALQKGGNISGFMGPVNRCKMKKAIKQRFIKVLIYNGQRRTLQHAILHVFQNFVSIEVYVSIQWPLFICTGLTH